MGGLNILVSIIHHPCFLGTGRLKAYLGPPPELVGEYLGPPPELVGEYLGPPPELVGEYLGPPPELVGEYLGPPPELVGEKQACSLNNVCMNRLPFRLMCNNTIQQTA
jgi:hypothetical protein